MASELESDLQDTVDLGRKLLVNLNAGKTELVLFDWSNDTGAIDMKLDGSVLEEKSSDAGIDFLFQIGLGLLHYLY